MQDLHRTGWAWLPTWLQRQRFRAEGGCGVPWRPNVARQATRLAAQAGIRASGRIRGL